MKEEGEGRKQACLNIVECTGSPAEEEMASVRQLLYEKESSRTAENELTLNLIGTEDNFNMGTCFETKANKM
ncbi:hypothetical protein C0J52_08763 [Blattella germanica]|nr:hypothetical protein C0J52_08763 [Blattella germanica]